MFEIEIGLDRVEYALREGERLVIRHEMEEVELTGKIRSSSDRLVGDDDLNTQWAERKRHFLERAGMATTVNMNWAERP